MTKALQQEKYFSQGEHYSHHNREEQQKYLLERQRYSEQYKTRLLDLRAHDILPPKLVTKSMESNKN
jgi:hypothetical protein